MSHHATSEAVHASEPQAASARKREALELFSELPRRYDALSALLSFGQDPRWRRALVRWLAPADGERVLDVAAGTGLVSAELLRRAAVSVVAVDQSPNMLAAARARFALPDNKRRPGGAIELLAAEAERLPFADASFDAITFTYLLRYVDDPAATMRELARVLRPGGRVASLEFGLPRSATARAGWRLYTAVGLPLAGRVVSRPWGRVGSFLGPSIEGFYDRHPLEQIVGYWRQAGLEQVSVRRMSFGAGVLMHATRAAGTHPAGGASPTPER